MSNRLSTCHKTKQVLLIKLPVLILLSTDNSNPLPYISSGLFAAANVTWAVIKQQKDPARRKTKQTSRYREIHKRKKSFKWEIQCAVRPGPPKDTGGEVGRLAEKLIQLGRTSQQRHVGFQRSTPSSEKAPFSRSSSLHVLSDTGIRVSGGLLQVIPCSFSSFVFFEKRREHPGPHRRRTELYGECRTEWMNAAETERLAPLPLAQTLPRRPVGRPQLP